MSEFISLTCQESGIKDAAGIEQLTELKALDISSQVLYLGSIANNFLGDDWTYVELLCVLPAYASFLPELEAKEYELEASCELNKEDEEGSRNYLKQFERDLGFHISARLSTIDVSALAQLETLKLDGNNLTAVDLSSNQALNDVDLRSNDLQTITVDTSLPIAALQYDGNPQIITQ